MHSKHTVCSVCSVLFILCSLFCVRHPLYIVHPVTIAKLKRHRQQFTLLAMMMTLLLLLIVFADAIHVMCAELCRAYGCMCVKMVHVCKLRVDADCFYCHRSIFQLIRASVCSSLCACVWVCVNAFNMCLCIWIGLFVMQHWSVWVYTFGTCLFFWFAFIPIWLCEHAFTCLFSLRSESLWLAFFLSETRYHSDFGPFVSQSIQFQWYLMFQWLLDIYSLIFLRSLSVGWKCKRSSLPLFNGLHSMTQKNWPKCIWKIIRTRRMPTNGN